MEFDKINAFLATAIGGLIFKWLAGAVSSFWSWLHKSYPEENFLITDIKIPNPVIRLSFCKYKLNTRTHKKSEKIIISTFGIIIIGIASFGTYQFTKIIIDGPINWLSLTDKETKDSFWIRSDEAKNKPGNASWYITPEICNNKQVLENIKSLKPQTKEIICNYMPNITKRDELSKETNRNSLGLMITIPIAYLSLLFFLSLGVGLLIDIYINRKITKFNNSEIIKSYQYIT